MTDTNLGAAAGGIFAKAFTLGYETGRKYVPVGGMALTAEQVEDVEALVATANPYSAPAARLRALFPATEPAAVRDGSDLVVVQRSHTAKAVQSWMTLDLWTDLGKNDKDFDAEYERQGFGDLWATLLGEVRALVQATTPAPAEPAEERRSFPTIQDVPNNTLFHTHGGNGSSLFVRNQSGDLRLCLNAGPEWSKLLRDEDFLPSFGPYVEVPWSKFPQPPADPFAQPAPAEPAEERCQSVSIFRERCALVPGHDGRHAANGCAWGYPPAPAEPAEEETKAERRDPDELAKRMALIWHDGWDACGERERGYLRRAAEMAHSHYASSPVVPAPTETGPWHAVAEIPKAVACIKDREGDVWRRCGSGWEHGALHDPVDYSPFVAVKEEEA